MKRRARFGLTTPSHARSSSLWHRVFHVSVRFPHSRAFPFNPAPAFAAMERFAQQTRENFALWQARAAELEAEPVEDTEQVAGTPLAWPSQAPNDFLTAFPPALPPSFRLPEDPLFPPFYHPHHRFPSVAPSSSSGSTSQYESCESSLPSPNFSPALEPLPAPVSPTSAGFPPRLELQTSSGPHSRAPSVASTVPSTAASVSSVFSLTNEATAAIRAAYKASVRKKKSFHRASWNPPPASLTPVPSPLAHNHNHAHHPLAHSHTPGSPVVGGGSSGGDSPVSLSAGSPSTGSLTPSPLTPDADPGTARPVLLKTALVSMSMAS